MNFVWISGPKTPKWIDCSLVYLGVGQSSNQKFVFEIIHSLETFGAMEFYRISGIMRKNPSKKKLEQT